MPKLEPAGITRKISLSQIVDTGNIREQYNDIAELAESIKKNGQLQPVVVKKIETENGEEQFELIAGYRRREAFKYLCEHGDDFNLINATIVTGDKLTLQLVENIQRSDLNARERERAIYQMYESGLKQNEIAARLSKGKGYISVHISAFKMRVIAEKNGIDLKDIETSTLRELLSIPESYLPEILTDLVNFGGTVKAAQSLVKAYQENKNPPLVSAEPAEKENETQAEPAPDDIDPLTGDEQTETPDEPIAPPIDAPPAPAAVPVEKPKPQKPKEPLEPIEADHAEIDINIVLTGIYDYVASIKKIMPEKGIESLTANAKIEAANDIIALIHEILKNA